MTIKSSRVKLAGGKKAGTVNVKVQDTAGKNFANRILAAGLPVLTSERIVLSAGHYTANAFTGILELAVPWPFDSSVFERAWRQLGCQKTGLHIRFGKGWDTKEMAPNPFMGLARFANKRELREWQKKGLDIGAGSYCEMGLLVSSWPPPKSASLYVKFHHLAMDGLSLVYFLNDLGSLYASMLASDNIPQTPTDAPTYRSVMEKYKNLEKRDIPDKQRFWKRYLQGHATGLQARTTSPSVNHSSFLGLKYLARIQKAKGEYGVDAFSLLTALYYKALWRTLGIDSLLLRVPLALRNHLNSSAERRLLASLSCSAPLLMNTPGACPADIARQNKIHLGKAQRHLPINPIPWTMQELASFCAVKDDFLHFSFTCVPFPRSFCFVPRHFSWMEALVDLELMVLIVPGLGMHLIFTYKESSFTKRELKAITKALKREILRL